MQMDSNIRLSYFDSAPYPFSHQPTPRQQSGRSAAVNMSSSPYFARTHSHSRSSPTLGHFSPSIRFNSYYSLAQQSPLPQPLPDYSSYPSDSSAASAESPLSSSSANESPLPEPPIDSMENDTSHVVGDDYYPYIMTDDATGYLFPHAPRAFALSGYVAENPEVYKHPVAAPLPMPLSVAMGYTYSPEVKKYQPLCLPPQPQEADPQQYSNSLYGSPPTPAANLTHPAGSDANSYPQDFDAAYQPQAATSSYHGFPASVPSTSHSCYQQPRQNIKVESIPDLVAPYSPPTDLSNSPNSLAVYDGIFETGSSPIGQHNTGISELVMRYMPSQSNSLSSMSMPVLPAPVPRQAYLGSSIVSDCERTCQEQEQQRQALRVQTQGLQEQRTVRPAEVSPVMGFTDLQEPEDEDAEGEPDIAAFNHHESSSNGGHSPGKRHFMPRGFVSQLSETFLVERDNDFSLDDEEDANGVDEVGLDDNNDDYGAEEVEDDDGDGDFVPHMRTTSKNTRSLRSRSFSGRNSARYHPYGSTLPQPAPKRAAKSPLIAASTLTPGSSSQVGKSRKNARSLPVPVPVPNLTKKSRGRRVPTVSNTGGSGRARGYSDPLGSRIYLCDISGCGKCFARGEHLKRHIRSIHTNEKPHRCPYPGCGKEFSRHDNLGQHMKVHKDLPKLMERMGVVDDV